MKRIFLVMLFLVSVGATAQSNSFLTSGGKLVWENVFITGEANIPGLISRHVKLKITSSGQNLFKGRGEDIRNTCPGTSVFMKDDFSFDFEIEVSDGKYRVSVTNIVFKKGKGSKVKATAAESYFIKDGQLQNTGTLPADLNCMDVYFNRIFNIAMYKNRS